MENLNLKTVCKQGKVRVANSQIELVSQEITLPISLQGINKQMEVRILKSLPVNFAIGLDFLEIFKININFVDRIWYFKENPSEIYSFEYEDTSIENCCGLKELSMNETTLLTYHKR